MLDAILFDIDGTLLDTNWAHVEAWQRTFEGHGYRIARDRIEREIGKGGDKLVPAILGEEADEKDGGAMRERQPREFARLGQEKGFKPFSHALELLDAARAHKLKIALATSSSKQHLKVLREASGVDLEGAADVITTADDADESKPSPDIVMAAVRKLGLCSAQCAMVGDTLYDIQAAKHAGVIGLGLLCGYQSQQTLLRAGARAVYRDAAHLFEELPRAIKLASPTNLHLSQTLLEALMHEALKLAERAKREGEQAIGCIITDGDGRIIASATEHVRRRRDVTAHAELLALRAACEGRSGTLKDRLLLSTREPCIMCTGAAMQAAIDSIIYGVRAPADSGTARVIPPETASSQMPRIVGGILEEECRRVGAAELSAW